MASGVPSSSDSQKQKKRVVIKTTTRFVVRKSEDNARFSGGSAGSDDLLSTIVRAVLVEAFVLGSLFTFLCLLQSTLHLHASLIGPNLKALKWTEARARTEQTYPAFDCGNLQEAISIDKDHESVDKMFFNASTTSEYAIDFIMQHGGAVFPDLISVQDARELREYLLEQSYNMNAQLPVLAHDFRRSIALTALEHPSIPKALRSIARSSLLRETLEGLLGPNPALLAFSTIVAEQGAGAQQFHVDKPPSGSAMQYAATFIPVYALLIPLQDTTAEMGATAIAPGTHRCNEMNRSFAEAKGFHVVANISSNQRQDSGGGIWRSGQGLLYHAQVRHCGSAHTKGPPRALLILSFGSKPDGRRYLPLLSYFALRWDMWGFTFNDLFDPERLMVHPWLKSLGLWKHPESEWGWTAMDDFCALFADHRYSKLGSALYRKLHGSLLGPFASVLMLDWTDKVEETSAEDDGPSVYEMYFVTLIQKLRWVVGFLTAVSCWKYLDYVNRFYPKDVRYSAMRLFLVFCIPLCLLAVVIVNINQHHRNSASIHSFRPYMEFSAVDNGQPLVEPKFGDVLISPALDTANHTAAYARILDYHQGNQQWREIAEKLELSMAGADQDVNYARISDAMKGLRFLRQVESGWVEIDKDEVYWATLSFISTLRGMTGSGECISKVDCRVEEELRPINAIGVLFESSDVSKSQIKL